MESVNQLQEMEMSAYERQHRRQLAIEGRLPKRERGIEFVVAIAVAALFFHLGTCL